MPSSVVTVGVLQDERAAAHVAKRHVQHALVDLGPHRRRDERECGIVGSGRPANARTARAASMMPAP
jgi:hypothetical protein